MEATFESVVNVSDSAGRLRVFDVHAGQYDTVAESALGCELRDRVHSVIDEVITPQDRVLDLGCGTGLDAAWLATRVASVRAIDASPRMVELARQRCAEFSNVIVEQGNASSYAADSVDVVVANFGVVNCVGPLHEFGDRLATMLKPGGHAVVVTMSPWCPIELAVGALSANKALVRRRRGVADPGYRDLDIHYASARTLATSFKPNLVPVRRESVGLVLPPFEQRSWVEGRPRLLRALAAIDRGVGPFGAFLGWGDHHIASFRRPS